MQATCLWKTTAATLEATRRRVVRCEGDKGRRTYGFASQTRASPAEPARVNRSGIRLSRHVCAPSGPSDAAVSQGSFMAIFSLNHSAIGKMTHAAGTSGAHVRYITRTQAQPDIVAHLIPADRNAARAWMLEHEGASRKNARVCDKLILALPVELDAKQRRALLQDYADQVTGGQAPYFAAIHAAGKDAKNPHAHLILVDRNPTTGKRVMLTTERGSTERFRETWEVVCNHHLKLAGIDTRIDRRSLTEQGIERTPQIHVGAEGQHVSENVRRPTSKAVEVFNGAGAVQKTRTIEYPVIDKGRTRREFNDQIIDANLQQTMSSPNWSEKKRAELALKVRTMTKLDEQRFAERRHALTRRTREDRAQAWASHRGACKAITETRKEQLASAKETTRQEYAPAWDEFFAWKSSLQTKQREHQQRTATGVKVAHQAIKAMKRGDDFQPGWLRMVHHQAVAPDTAKQVKKAVNTRLRQLQEQQRGALKDRTDRVRTEARAAMAAEKQRYKTERAEQQAGQRGDWKTFFQEQSQARDARDSFRAKQEAVIVQVEAAITRTDAGWKLGRASASAPAPVPAEAGRAANNNASASAKPAFSMTR